MQKIYGPPAYQKPSGGLYLSANHLNIPNTTITVVNLDVIQAPFSDEIEDIVAHTITPGVAGLYLIIGQVTFYNIVADRMYRVYVDVGGTALQAVNHSSHGDSLSVSVTFLYWMTAVDVLSLRVWHNAGVDTIDIEGVTLSGHKRTFLFCTRVR